jgi:two-component system LytT family response regulator
MVEVKVLFATTESSELIDFVNDHESIDIVLLDVSPPNSSGFEIAEFIKIKHPTIAIIFTSTCKEYAFQCYKYYPVDFLVKPINIVRFKKTLHYISEKIVKSYHQPKKIGVKSNGIFHLIDIDRILFVERKGRKTFIHLENEAIVECNESIKQLEELLDMTKFFRTHQSFIVALDKIEEIHKDLYTKAYNIKIKNSKQIVNLSRNKYVELKKFLAKYLVCDECLGV